MKRIRDAVAQEMLVSGVAWVKANNSVHGSGMFTRVQLFGTSGNPYMFHARAGLSPTGFAWFRMGWVLSRQPSCQFIHIGGMV
jgi:apolipoprotein N-acyltransferase